MASESDKSRRRLPGDLIQAIANVFRLPGTAKMILKVLGRARQTLSVKEIAERVRRSERSVRTHLGILMKKGILIRKVIITKNKKLAYKYALGPIEKIVHSLRSELGKQLKHLEALEKRLIARIMPAKTKS
jgi:predicted DNA-binding transcriptional regulator